MAQPTTAKFGKFIVKLGDGADPEVFAAPCGFTSKSLQLTKTLSEVSIPDCNEPDAPIVIGRDVQSTSASISGEGVLAAEAVEAWMDAYKSTDSVSVQLEITFSSGVLKFVGKMHVASISLGAEQGGRVTISVEMQSDGALVQTSTIA
ncbi:phage tail tube protein [Kaistia sp. MMO-174]|uniref:phage tail tube protein n=1 Tax=Kaistia sp. MMO-174 TaxID=3081256 RepID=UPI00301B063A